MAGHPDVFSEVRGTGLMLGLVCVTPVGDVVQAAYDAQLITIPAAENTLRLLPALTLSDDEASEALSRLEQVAQAIKKAKP